MKEGNMRICQFAEQPGEHECLEAIWSQGKACKKCPVPCYRQGMSALEATSDNKKLVAQKQGAKGLSL